MSAVAHLQEKLQRAIDRLPEFVRSRWPALSASTLTHSQALLIAALLHAHRPTSSDAGPSEGLDAQSAREFSATWDELARALGVRASQPPPETLAALEHNAAWEALAAEGVGETALLRCLGCNKVVASSIMTTHEAACSEQQRVRSLAREDLKRKRQEELADKGKRARPRPNEPKLDSVPGGKSAVAEDMPSVSTVVTALHAQPQAQPTGAAQLLARTEAHALLLEGIAAHKSDHYAYVRAPEYAESDPMKRANLKFPPSYAVSSVKIFQRRTPHASHPYPVTELPAGVRSYNIAPPQPPVPPNALTPSSAQNVVQMRQTAPAPRPAAPGPSAASVPPQ